MDAPADGAYAEWQHSAPFLYEKAIVKVFQDGPVSTCQWKDTQMRDKSKRYIVYSLITGTFNLDGKSNFLNIHTVRFPNEALANDSDATPEDFKYFEDIKDRIDVLKNIPHNGPITRARSNPINDNIIATRGYGSLSYIYDQRCFDEINSNFKQRDNSQNKNQLNNPMIVLQGHENGGIGTAWNSIEENSLLTSDENGSILHWDINSNFHPKINKSSSYNEYDIILDSLMEQLEKKKSFSIINPISQFYSESDENRDSNQRCINTAKDVCWMPNQKNEFISVGDENQIVIWDLRKEQYAAKIHQQHSGYNGSFLSIDINKFYPNLAITSSSDTRIYLWDLRNMSRVLHLCAFHRMPSSIAKWNPNVPNIFASGGNDSLVVIWDLEKIGAEVSVKDSIDGPPEAIFLHSGHVSPCCDISWNPHEPFGIASVEREGMLHIWEPSSAVINPQLIDAEFMPKRN